MKIKAVVLDTFAIKIESVKCKRFPYCGRSDEEVVKKAINIPNSERKEK
jgi:hypothetical protein